jgi:Sortase domain
VTVLGSRLYRTGWPCDSGGDKNIATTGPVELKVRRRSFRATTTIAAASLIAAGAVLLGIGVSQHQHHDDTVAVQAARRVQVDRAAVVEAQQSRVRPSPVTTAPRADQVGLRTKLDRSPAARAEQLRAAALVLAADHPGAAGPRRQQPSPARPPVSGENKPGAVSEIRGSGATLVIPALQVHAPVVATGAVDGSMTIPADVHIVGWYDGTDSYQGTTYSVRSPWPGQPGVSVLAGHINWVGQGPGALYYIGQLVPGDPVDVLGSNRVATYWRVSQGPITLPKAELPANLFVNTGPPKLALVTCGGPYDAATGHYLDNVIVWATLTTR